MKLTSKEIKGVTVFELDGNIKSMEDLETFSNTVDGAISDGCRKLLLNFEGVNFINSSGLGRLIMIIRKMGEVKGTLKVSNLGDDLEELFNFTKLNEKVNVFPTEEDALADFGNS